MRITKIIFMHRHVTVTVIDFPAVNTGKTLRHLVSSLFSNKEKAGYHATHVMQRKPYKKGGIH
jgi:hypothetical protein